MSDYLVLVKIEISAGLRLFVTPRRRTCEQRGQKAAQKTEKAKYALTCMRTQTTT